MASSSPLTVRVRIGRGRALVPVIKLLAWLALRLSRCVHVETNTGRGWERADWGTRD